MPFAQRNRIDDQGFRRHQERDIDLALRLKTVFLSAHGTSAAGFSLVWASAWRLVTSILAYLAAETHRVTLLAGTECLPPYRLTAARVASRIYITWCYGCVMGGNLPPCIVFPSTVLFCSPVFLLCFDTSPCSRLVTRIVRPSPSVVPAPSSYTSAPPTCMSLTSASSAIIFFLCAPLRCPHTSTASRSPCALPCSLHLPSTPLPSSTYFPVRLLAFYVRACSRSRSLPEQTCARKK